MTRLVVRERLAHHPLLGRNINHDSQSWAYRVRRTGRPIVDVRHAAHMPVLNQGSLGSCTGNAGIGCLGRDPFYGTLTGTGKFPLTEDGAVALYSRATGVDPYAGTYPPNDTGSDGLSIAKVLKAEGMISGYLWAFTPQEALEALMDRPVITGVPWFNSMFDPQPNGECVVNPASGDAGGHEVCVDQFEFAGGADGGRVWFSNSWGEGWGRNGRAWWSFNAWSRLLAMNGDVTQFVPVTKPAPTPEPVEPAGADAELWAATKAWAWANHTGSNRRAAVAVRAWAKTKGLR